MKASILISPGWDFLNFSELILTVKLRVTLDKSSVRSPYRSDGHYICIRIPVTVASLNLFGTQNTPGNPDRLKTEIIQLA